jgi:hypothetical protein
MRIKGVSFESLALPQALRFRPPLVEVARNPMGFNFEWQLLTYVFDLPNPFEFPALTGWTDDELSVLRRFSTVARRIAGGEVISGKYQVSVSYERVSDRETLVRDLPSDELMAGFAVSFRQLNSNEEPASWHKVRNILSRKSHGTDDQFRDQRLEWLSRWWGAHGRLLGSELSVLVGRKLEEEGKWGGPFPGDGLSPTTLISQFHYGDLIHWGRHAGFVAQLAEDPTREALTLMQFLKCCGALCHIYFGTAVLVDAATKGLVPATP